MSKKIRVITASGKTSSLIDKGSEIDSRIKTLANEDKEIKTQLTKIVTDAQNKDEEKTSVRLNGKSACALVSVVESYDVNTGAKSFKKVIKAVDSGILSGVIKKERKIAIPVLDIDKAIEILKLEGIDASVVESFSVDAEEFRRVVGSDEFLFDQKEDLKECVSKSVSYRVKYEKL